MRNFPSPLRWLLALIVVTASMGGLWWMLRGTQESLQVTGAEAGQETQRPSGSETVETRWQEGNAETRVALEERVPSVPSRVARPGDGRSLRGRVEFVGLDPELEAESGSSAEGAAIYLLFTAVGGERDGVVEELDGLGWSCELPYRIEDLASVKVAGVARSERLWHAVAGSEFLPLDCNVESVLQLELAPVTSIRVVDAKTRAPIPRFRAAFWPAGADSGPTQLSVDGEQGIISSELEHEFTTPRLELHPREDREIWPGEPCTARLSAAGHGEVSIEVVMGSGVEHEVRLPRAGDALFRWPSEDVARRVNSVLMADGGSLVLQVESLEPPSAQAGSQVKRTVHLGWEDFHPKLSVDGEVMMLAEARFEKLVEDLVGGSYRASLAHRSESIRGTTRLAEAQFSIQAGRRVEVLLQDVVDPDAVDVPLELEFAMPEGSGAPAGESVWLSRFNEGEWEGGVALKLVSGTWRTHAVVVRPGRFRASVRGLRNFEREFEFPPRSVSPVVLPVPTLHHFRIQLVSTSQDATVKKVRVHWRSPALEGEQQAERVGAGPGVSEFYSPALPVTVSLSGSARIELLDGPSLELDRPGEHLLTCLEKPRLRVRFRTDGMTAKVPVFLRVYFSQSPDGSRIASQERIRGQSDQPDELRIWFPGAGAYQLEFRELPEFEPIPPLDLNVGPRHDQWIELPLVPRR